MLKSEFWTIDKKFEFDYSHRVWQQVLDFKLAETNCHKCKRNHGHRGVITVHLSASKLDEKGMVMDFTELNFFKRFVDDVLDHKCILDINDPAVPHFYPILASLTNLNFKNFLRKHEEEYYTIDSALIDHLPIFQKEIYEGIVFVDFIPTSERLAKWFYEILSKKLEGYAKVDKIEFNETPKSRSIYSK